MSRWFGRSARIVPGPLKAVSPAGGSPVPLTALALAAAALAGGLVLFSHLSAPRPEARSPVADLATPALLTLEPVVAIVAHAEPSEPAVEASTTPPPASVAPVVERALFQLDALPVLETNGEDLDIGTVAPKPAARSASRRSAGAHSAALTAR